MDDSQLLRYSRHILLDEVGIEGQQKLLASHALIIGAGGLGSPVAFYLGSAGVGHITVVDDDRVDATNLQRQIAHTLSGVGTFKAESIRKAVQNINPDVEVTTITQRADDALLDALAPNVDVMLDCTDNFATRHTLNRASVRHGKPLVSGAAIRFDGQVSVFDPRDATSPCYACVFPEAASFEEAQCATMGVFAPMVGIIGSVQAAETLRLLCGIGDSLAGRMQMLDGRSMSWNEMRVPRSPDCRVCGSGAANAAS
jgi:molybdopterin/thiamine biosynthesis adenylyltransferase